MSNTNPDPPARASGFLSEVKQMLAAPLPAEDPGGDDILPAWDVPPPTALPVAEPFHGENIPMAAPVALPVPLAFGEVEAMPLAVPAEAPLAEPIEPVKVKPSTIRCPACTSDNPISQPFCGDCGYYFSEADLACLDADEPTPVAVPKERVRLQDRYELGELLSDRLGVKRFRALDHGPGTPIHVVIVQQALASAVPMAAQAIPVAEEAGDEILPGFDEPPPTFPPTAIMGRPIWPSVAWERRLLHTLEHPALPVERDYFSDESHEYLVEEVPTGQLLWDAWDDPEAGSDKKFGHLAEVAETLHRLHQCGAMLEGLRPDIIVVADSGHVRLTDLSDLLPLPLPIDVPVRGGLYTAPELLKGQGAVDARADLYSFGAMLYALLVGRELNEKTDFDGPGNPKPFIPRFPDTHPALGRLMMKTFRKEVEARFPTDEAGREDATGFTELIRTLEVLRRTYDNVHLEIASWTSTGIVRTGNEDAYAVLHAGESRQDDMGEAALIFLCDGMGGYEAGEIAAALTIQTLRKHLIQMRPFSVAAGESPFLTDPVKEMSRPEGHAAPGVDIDAVKQALKAALREANRVVFQTSRVPGSKRRGMGCTAEAVYVDGRNVIVGHVGDSRTYHLHEGQLIQLTRDQTLVNRLVELGTISAEDAEKHPRRNELQQAIGGQPDVDPGVYHGKLVPGDWIVVCSDGLTNHVNSRDLQHMLLSEAGSAEVAARRLVNLTLIEGATDNVTVVVVRVT